MRPHPRQSAENLDKAIAHLEAALTVRTREALPRERAQTQNNLAVIRGNTSARTCFLWRASRNSWAMP